jgi:hypothetical protein
MINEEHLKPQSTNLWGGDNALLERLRMMPDSQPSHGFDARLTEALLRDISHCSLLPSSPSVVYLRALPNQQELSEV